ncbi:adenylate/guanylate cyclase domain-containing protein [Azospirillum sp. TSO22-1]|uniref:adenylate/guanylate cyclase domain-containing protein n=1 Tax=Azospirillum sp. TSO22-1 TaxID=716789 RepID=UPI000D611946|nr:adenylate/guanylate cyclase domain-containing protein [Azospirillum sp. TSO22-1]PWC53808.1 hypothetical protein TSO221_09825 [Azospirillum sp. TSO22-1]
MARREIIDVDADPAEARRRRIRRFFRLGVPILGVLMMAAALVGTALYSYSVNRRDALVLARDLIEALDQRAGSQVSAYLDSAADAVRILAYAGGGPDAPASETIALALMGARPQLATLYVGAEDGRFMMVQRSDADTLDTKRITIGPAGRTVTWTRRTTDGTVRAIEEDPADRYDPASRPWYRAAVEGNRTVWSDIYVFFTRQSPGITVSRVLPNRSGAVAAADLDLMDIGGFLDTLKVGATGKAVLVDGDGRLVAVPDIRAMPRPDGDALRPARIEELGDPLLREVFDRVRIAGEIHGAIEIGGNRHMVSAHPLRATLRRDWWLLLIAHESDFVEFVAANNRKALLLSGTVVLLAMAMAGFLVWQAYSADRNVRAVRRRQRELERQGAGFTALGRLGTLADPGDAAALRRAMEIAADATMAHGVSLWRIDGERLICTDGFDRDNRGHVSAAAIPLDHCPLFRQELLAGEIVATGDAETDPRTSGLAPYLRATGRRSLLAVPVRAGDRTLGCLWIEDGAGDVGVSEGFARLLGKLLAPGFVAAEAHSPAAEAPVILEVEAHGSSFDPPTLRSAAISVERDRLQLQEIARRGLREEQVSAMRFPQVTVLVLRMADDVALATGNTAQTAGIGEIVAACQRAAERLGIRYLKILTDQIVAAEGFDGNPAAAATRLAAFALEMDAECDRLFTRLGRPPGYAMGFDTGPVMGSAVGFGQVVFNVWGETVRVAGAMATAAPSGAIQVTETTYALLRNGFAFRVRGAFYLERLGEMTTYFLRGRL